MALRLTATVVFFSPPDWLNFRQSTVQTPVQEVAVLYLKGGSPPPIKPEEDGFRIIIFAAQLSLLWWQTGGRGT